METVYLRALDTGDVERTLRWHNDPTLYETLVGTFRFVSPAAEAEWIRRKAAFSTDEVSLAICLDPAGTHIGNIALTHIDAVARHAELQMFIGEANARARGCGTQALRLLL